MIMERIEDRSGTQVLFVLAMLVVVVFGLRLAAPILIPFSMALFVAILSLPIMTWLKGKGVPAVLAIVITVLVDVSVFGLVVLLASQSASEFQEQLPRYIVRLENLTADGLGWLQARGVPLGDLVDGQLLDQSRVIGLVGGTVGRALAFVSNTFVVLLILVFTLGEAAVFPAKFRAILGRERGHSSRMTKIVREIQEYLGIKTLISLATGILLGTWAWLMDLDFPVLLGLIAFLLNYVPTIGSILASIPALLLALVLHGVGHSVVVGVGYVGVNTLFGNIIEPSLLGRRLGLSTLVVLLSLLFWGWLWGPVGALLAVPLTMVLKIMLENSPDLRWMAILLDKSPPQQPVPVPAAASVESEGEPSGPGKGSGGSKGSRPAEGTRAGEGTEPIERSASAGSPDPVERSASAESPDPVERSSPAESTVAGEGAREEAIPER